MGRPVSLTRIRRTRVALWFAALLVTLTVTPFTAPFAAVDIVELVGTVSHDDKVPTTLFDAAVAAGVGQPVVAADLDVTLFLRGLRTTPNRLLLTKTVVLRI